MIKKYSKSLEKEFIYRWKIGTFFQLIVIENIYIYCLNSKHKFAYIRVGVGGYSFVKYSKPLLGSSILGRAGHFVVGDNFDFMTLQTSEWLKLTNFCTSAHPDLTSYFCDQIQKFSNYLLL